MKKSTKIIALTILCIGLVLVGLHLLQVIVYKPIPLVDGLSFGVTPKRTKILFGIPLKTEQNTCDTGKTAYTYQTEVLGQEAKVSCLFLDDKKLTDVQINWVNCDDALFQDVCAALHDYYSQKANFFQRTEETDVHGSTCITIGIDNDASGIFYTITKTGKTVSLSCIDLS